MPLVDWRWIQTPVGGYWVSPAVYEAYNDLWRGYHALERQVFEILPKRLRKAETYRRAFKDAIRP